MRWTGYVVRVGVLRNALKILVGNTKEEATRKI